MRRYLFDTGIAADFMDDRLGVRRRAITHAAQGDVIGICPPVLGELAFGIENSDAPERRMPALRRVLGQLTLWPYDERAAFEYGRLCALLRRRGRAMQSVDVQIAAVALTLGNCTVVTKDGDLGDVPGLTMENWATAS